MNGSLSGITTSPYRLQLERHIRRVFPTLSGSVLDIGSKNRRYDRLLPSRPTAVDLVPDTLRDVGYGDISSLPFPEHSFDVLTCIEVLEYVTTPQKAIDECARVLRQGGKLVLSVPFLYRLHDDQLRYTETFLRTILTQFSIVEFHSIGGGWAALLNIIWGSVYEIRFIPLRYLCLALYAPLGILTSLFKGPRHSRYPSGYFIVAQKI